MTKHRMQVLLDSSQYLTLARQAQQEGVSASELLRRLVDEKYASKTSNGLDLSSVRGKWSGRSMTNREIDRVIYGD